MDLFNAVKLITPQTSRDQQGGEADNILSWHWEERVSDSSSRDFKVSVLTAENKEGCSVDKGQIEHLYYSSVYPHTAAIHIRGVRCESCSTISASGLQAHCVFERFPDMTDAASIHTVISTSLHEQFTSDDITTRLQSQSDGNIILSCLSWCNTSCMGWELKLVDRPEINPL